MTISGFEIAYAAIIVVILLGLALYYGWRQWQTLRGLRGASSLSSEDRRYYRAQAWRRLASSGLMIVLAGLLIGSYVMGQERQASELSQHRQAALEQAASPSVSIEQQRFVNQYGTFWLVFSLLLLVLVGLALVDLMAIRRFGIRHYRQIQADRREMIEREVTLLRRDRNGV